MKRFNVTGLCVTGKHYMVDTSNKIAQIRKMIDNEMYFTINRARQYGKTTTLNLLRQQLADQYVVASISFEGVGEALFDSEKEFCKAFLEMIYDSLQFANVSEEYAASWLDESIINLKMLNRHIKNICSDKTKKFVLLVDEVDKSSNNQLFLHFLGMLRDKYLLREAGMDYTFQSVVLAGVYDVKNIKLKMIKEGYITPKSNTEKIYNSPWNVAVNFKVDMSFNPPEIATMLVDYESDNNTGMDINLISNEIYNYTSGYPFLVSRICQAVDEELDKNWTMDGVREAVKLILAEQNTLFDDMFKNFENYEDLYDMMYEMIVVGEKVNFSFDNPSINLAATFGFVKDENGKAVVTNEIFAIRMYNYFISKDETNSDRKNKQITNVLHQDVYVNGKFNMELVLQKFSEHYATIANKIDTEFLERNGRMIFLTYLKPLINGEGFYHIEAQTLDARRMDIIVDYGKDQFVVELKLWHGGNEHDKAFEQLCQYLDDKHAKDGYLLTFNFNKNKQTKCEWENVDNKHIFDVIV